MKRLVVDEGRCTGCDSGMLSCSFARSSRFSYDEFRVGILKDRAIAIRGGVWQ